MTNTYNFNNTLDHRHNDSYRWDNDKLPQNFIGMGTADLDFTCPDCIQDVLMNITKENTYNYRKHSKEYYQAVINWYHRHYNLDIQEEWLSNVPSTIASITMAIRTYASNNDSVIVQAPTFQPLIWAIEGAGCKIIDNEMILEDGHYKMDFDDFESKLKIYRPKVFLLVNPHNPTGKVYTKRELETLVQLCQRYDVKIVSDEVHSLVLSPNHLHYPILTIDQAKDISIQVVSLSKGYNIMSLPHAIITISNDKLREQWLKQIQSYSFGYAVNSFAIAAVTTLLQGNGEEWLKELNGYLLDNINEAINRINNCALPIKAIRPEGGYLLWIDCRGLEIDPKLLGKYFLDNFNIELNNGYDFGSGGAGFVRMNLGVTKEVLNKALTSIEKGHI